MANATERLLELKGEIDQAKLDKASVDGALKQNLQRLNDEFQCRSLDSAVIKLGKLKEQKAKLSIQIEGAVAQLETNYQW